uniref:Methyltransferase FkbM domain-containing protein n=1 Tax=Acrobeloides nanus TaxID=290746 RepID=A0A914CF20_9BILA
MFLRHLQSCLAKHVPIEIREFEAYDRKKEEVSEKKWFLKLDKNFPQKQCVWLTIGIGGELATEEQVFKNEYPECRIFGIEASEKSYGDFAQIGTIIPHAVGVEEKNASVMTIDCCKDGMKFIKKELRIRPLHKLLDEYVKSRIIHFAIFDIEGMENLLLDELVYGGKLYMEKIVFCQIDWELHFDDQYKKIGLKPNKIGTIINLINNSQYLPIIVSPTYNYHHLTLLNIKDPVCRGKGNVLPCGLVVRNILSEKY